MDRAVDRKHLPWMLAVVGVFVFLNIDSVWSGSVDLAHHYALAFRISEQWVLTSPDPSLADMTIYPRGSHMVAAGVGALLGSAFVGVQVTTLVSVALLWLCAILLLNSLPGKMARVALTTLIGLVIVNALTVRLELHGHEIVGNFFYAQLVGHAVLFASILLAIHLEKRHGIIWSISSLAALMLINATIHLLPAVEMLGVIVGLLGVHALFEHWPNRSASQRLALAALIAIFLAIALYLHPSFSAMRHLSENDGVLRLNNIPYPVGLIVLCIAVLATSLTLFLRWLKSTERNEILVAKYLSIYGAVTAALCLLQYAVKFLGDGSDYAVKKYAFGLTSILLLQLSTIPSQYIRSSRNAALASSDSRLPVLHPIVVVAAFVVALFLSVPIQKALDASDIVLLERKLISLADNSLPAPENRKNNAVVGIAGVSRVMNYMFSIAITKTPMELAIRDILTGKGLSDLSSYSYIISSRENKDYGSDGCESTSSGSLSIVSAQCIESRAIAMSYCKETFDFSVNGTVPSGLLNGFSFPEPHGRWSDGDHASFECIADDTPVTAVKLQVAPFIYGSLKRQKIEVSLNGKAVYEGVLSDPRGAENPIVIEIPAAAKADKYVLDFKFPDAKSPKEVGLNDDTRNLGFSFQRIMFE